MAEIPREAQKFKGETRERVRRALLTRLERDELRASTKLVTVSSLVDAGSRDRNATTTCLRLWRRGELSVGDSWGDPPPAPVASSGGEADANDDLAELVRSARTDADREAVALEVAARVAAGHLDDKSAAVIRQLLGDARASAVKVREVEPPPEDPTRYLLASAEAMSAARALDLIVDDARRDRLIALLAAELEADRVQMPNVDEGGV